MLINENRPMKFVRTWIVAGHWFALLALAANFPFKLDPLYSIFLPLWLNLPIGAYCQWLLIKHRLANAGLWLAAGLMAGLLAPLFAWAFTRLLLHFGDPGPAGMFVIGVALIVTMGLALALTQCIVIARWRLGGLVWLCITTIAAVLASAVGVFVLSVLGEINGALHFRLELRTAYLILLMAQTLSQAIFFGGVTGWWLWRRLNAASVDGVRLA